jgi:hypothetical protein
MVTTPILLINEVAPTQTDKTTTINDAIVALESATQDQLAVSLAGGNLTLSATQFTRYAVFSVLRHHRRWRVRIDGHGGGW